MPTLKRNGLNQEKLQCHRFLYLLFLYLTIKQSLINFISLLFFLIKPLDTHCKEAYITLEGHSRTMFVY